MPGLFAESGYRRLYAGHIRAANWLAIGTFVVLLPVMMLAIAPNKLDGFLLGMGISILSLLAVAGILAVVARRQVVHVSRSGDTITVGLLSVPGHERSFQASVTDFSRWTLSGVGKMETISFYWRGQRYTLPLWDATQLDPEGFGELDSALGAALAARANAKALRKGR